MTASFIKKHYQIIPPWLTIQKSFIGFTAFLISSLFIISCSPQVMVRSHLQKSDIVVDGNLNDWKDAGQYIRQENISIASINNGDVLFLSIRVTDSKKSMDLISSGFTLWLDDSGKKKKSYGIQFPAVDNKLFEQFLEASNGRRSSAVSSYNFITKDSLIRSIKFVNILEKGKAEITIPLYSPQTLDIAIAEDSSTHGLIYELAIPMNNGVLSFNPAPGSSLYLGMEYLSINPNTTRSNSPVGFQIGIGMGSFGIGRYGGMGGYPGMMGGPPSNQPVVTWVLLTLARP